MIIIKEFSSAGEMAEWLSRSWNIGKLKRDYPPEEGYTANMNLFEKRVEVDNAIENKEQE